MVNYESLSLRTFFCPACTIFGSRGGGMNSGNDTSMESAFIFLPFLIFHERGYTVHFGTFFSGFLARILWEIWTRIDTIVCFTSLFDSPITHFLTHQFFPRGVACDEYD